MYANISFTEFLFSNSGHVKSHEALSLGWVAGILSGLAALIGMPNQASADPCFDIERNTCVWFCRDICAPEEQWWTLYCHHVYPHNNCRIASRSCGC